MKQCTICQQKEREQTLIPTIKHVFYIMSIQHFLKLILCTENSVESIQLSCQVTLPILNIPSK